MQLHHYVLYHRLATATMMAYPAPIILFYRLGIVGNVKKCKHCGHLYRIMMHNNNMAHSVRKYRVYTKTAGE